MKNRSLLSMITDATAILFEDVTTDPIDEIRGHLTAKIIRDWIKNNSIGLPVEKSVLYFNIEKRFVAVFLLSSDDNFIHLPSGKRAASVFSARTMDDEMRRLFRSDNIVIISI